MGFSASRVVVGAAPVPLNVPTVGGQRLMLNNRDTLNAVDLGGASVVAAAGYMLPPLTREVLQVNAGEVLYAVRTGATNVTIDVLRSGV